MFEIGNLKENVTMKFINWVYKSEVIYQWIFGRINSRWEFIKGMGKFV